MSTKLKSYQDVQGQDWYAGAPASYSEDETNNALAALHELWPERIETVENASARGASIIIPVLRDGILVARCRQLQGFETVLDRWRRGERSARAEAVFAEALLACGISPVLDVALGPKRLDLEIQGTVPTFVEVVSPETSDSVKDALELLTHVANELVALGGQVHTDALLDSDFSVDRLPRLLEAVGALSDLDLELSIDGHGAIMKRPASLPIQAYSPLSRPVNKRPLYWASTGHVREGKVTSATVGIALSDERARRFLSGELHHFSKSCPSVLAINTSAVAGGKKTWRHLLEPRLTPTQNRRVGAIVLFEEYLGGEPFRSRVTFSVISNVYGYIPFPSRVLAVLDQLDGFEHT